MTDIVAHQVKDVRTLEKHMKKLRQQLELMSREREDQLDKMEQLQLVFENTQTEIAQLRESLRVKVAECEELKRKAYMEAFQLVKKQWCKKLEELSGSNTGLLHELQLRNECIAKLQQNAVKAVDCGIDITHEKLLDNVAELTTELLHRERLMIEKDAVLHEYEAQVERAERAAHNALESKCKLEFRVGELMQERNDMLKTLAELNRRNRELEICEPLPDVVSFASASGDGEQLENSDEALLARTGEQKKIQCENRSYLHLQRGLQFFLSRIASREEQLQVGNRFHAWMAFVLHKKIDRLRTQEQRIASSEATVAMLGEALEKGEACVYWTKEVAAEMYAQLEVARNALNDEKKKHDCKQEACEETRQEMAERIAALEAQVREKQEEEKQIQNSLPRILSFSEKSSYTVFHPGTVHASSTPLFVNSSGFPRSPNAASESFPAAVLLPNNADLDTSNPTGIVSETISDTIDRLSTVQDASEAGAIIATLLSLHRQGVEAWRVRATEAQHQAENAEKLTFDLSAFLQRCALPYLFILNESYADILTRKNKYFLVEHLCVLADMLGRSAALIDANGDSKISLALKDFCAFMLREWSK